MKLTGALLLFVGFAIFAFVIPWFSYRRFKRVWKHPKIVLSAIMLVSIFIGYFLSTWTRTISEIQKVSGFPLPVAIFKLEDGHWIDYVVPQPTAIAIMLLNSLVVSSVLFIIACISSLFFSSYSNTAEQGAAANP